MKKENNKTGETDGAEEQEEVKTWDTVLANEPEPKKPAEDAPRQVPVIVQFGELSLGDKLNKLYHELRRDVRSDDNLRHTIQSIGSSIDLGPGQYKTAAVLLKSAYSQIKIEAVKAKAAEMYSLITGAPIEKKS